MNSSAPVTVNESAGPAPVKTRPRNLVISGTNFWNPGDDFVRDGIIRILREVFGGAPLNFLFYNFNADFFPQSKFSGIADFLSEGDLDKYRDDIDAIIIAGLPAGDELKDLYYWILANGLEGRVCVLGAGYENSYIAHHIAGEPEATVFRNARIVTGRTARTPEFIRAKRIQYHHIHCPAILSVPTVKEILPGKKIERIGFSIQLPQGEGISNHACAAELYDLSVQILRELSVQHPVEVVAHHKTEYFHFLNLLRGENIPVVFSSFYRDLFELYPRYDLMITTRLHAGLFANGHGIPGIIINDTDRHTHTLEGFPHSVWVNNRAQFDRALARWREADLAAIAREAEEFKQRLLARYLGVLRPVLDNDAKPALRMTPERSGELKAALLARRIEYGRGVHLQEGTTRWVSNYGELRLPTQRLSGPAALALTLGIGDLWCYKADHLQTTVNLDGKRVRQAAFTEDKQEFKLTIPLQPSDRTQVLTLESSASFVPREIDENSRDRRRLAVKLSDVNILLHEQ